MAKLQVLLYRGIFLTILSTTTTTTNAFHRCSTSSRILIPNSSYSSSNNNNNMNTIIHNSNIIPRTMMMTTKLNTMCGSIHSDDDDERINKHDTLRCSSNSRITNTAKNTNNRRTFLSLSLLLAVALPPIEAANAVMTDETDNYADNYWSSSSRWSSRNSLPSPSSSSSSPIDEIVITISKKELQSKGGIGLELADIEFRTNRRVYVKSVLSGSVAESLGIEKNWIIVSVNNQSTERTNVDGVAMMIYTAATTTTSSSTSANNAIDGDDNVAIRFRNPIIFQNQLKNLSSSSSDDATTPANNVVTTQIAPAGDTTQRNAKDGSVKNGRVVTSQTDQRLSVSQLVPPKVCTRGATMDDLLEISYIGRLYDDETQGSSDGGAIFDGSAVKIDGKGIPGRGNDVSLFFVLGKQPFGQFPPGWDVGMEGMCVGERRRLLIPPVLGYGSKGLPRRGIPPNATLQYDVTLVSINGLAMPQ